jgi:hypothetical protein
MHSPTDLRNELIELAEPVVPTEGYEALVLTRAGRIRAWRRVAGSAAVAACVAVVVTMVQLVGIGSAPQLAASRPDGAFLGWAPTVAVDSALLREATSAWDLTGPHTAVRALITAHTQILPSVVILEGYDEQGRGRLAFFTSDTGAGGVLRLRVDRAAPDPVSTKVISVISPRLGAAVGSADTGAVTAIALAMPGITAVQFTDTAVDQDLRQNPVHATGRFVVMQFPSGSTPETMTVYGYAKAAKPLARWKEEFSTPVDGGASGDAQGVPCQVVSRSDQQIVVSVAAGHAVRPGQLAVVAAGLVGRVATVAPDRNEATIDLVTSTAFTARAYTNISDVPGMVRGTGGAVVMDQIPTGANMLILHGNRVVVPDPAQGNDQVGAVTIGRASADKSANAGSLNLTLTADLAHLSNIWIMTPYSDAN